ncbi:MAG: DUF1080 domain-containing protein [Paraglaciecola sp.]|uniref:3-keto-disaccharide hydrolase n=1 Tax=Paraglaciecola sp. TaxID=1920173 RepID=UPI0032997117
MSLSKLCYTMCLLAFFPVYFVVAAPSESTAKRTEVWEPIPRSVAIGQQGIPTDAIIIFNGNSFDALKHEDSSSVSWELQNGIMTVKPSSGDIVTRASFCDAQFHVEWRVPMSRYGDSNQHWGNSGLKIQERYEIQILHSVDNPTYVNGQAGAIYKQYAPLVNASLDAGEWQTYDIIFTAPRFDEHKVLTSPAFITLFHNGVLVQNHVEVKGTTKNVGDPSYTAHGCAPLIIQEHTASVSFRNIWARKL